MVFKILPITADASFRTFYRLVLNKNSKIFVITKKEKYKNLIAYSAINNFLISNKILAPRTFQHNFKKGIMTNKIMYFIANWKMYGNLKSLNTLYKVIKFSKSKEIKKGRLIYCPPYTLISSFLKKFENCLIDIGGQNCHESED